MESNSTLQVVNLSWLRRTLNKVIPSTLRIQSLEKNLLFQSTYNSKKRDELDQDALEMYPYLRDVIDKEAKFIRSTLLRLNVRHVQVSTAPRVDQNKVENNLNLSLPRYVTPRTCRPQSSIRKKLIDDRDHSDLKHWSNDIRDPIPSQYGATPRPPDLYNSTTSETCNLCRSLMKNNLITRAFDKFNLRMTQIHK